MVWVPRLSKVRGERAGEAKRRVMARIRKVMNMVITVYI